MNRHPLSADFNMYYNGTYIFRQGPKGYEAMMVEGTDRNGDDTMPSGVNLMGQAYNSAGELGFQTWTGDEIINFRPISGYYAVGRTKERSSYLSFSVNNRTQRKGFDPRNVLLNSSPWAPNGQRMVQIFEQAQGLDSRPGARDIFVDKAGKVHWKGVHTGTNTDGKYVSEEAFKQFEEIVCRLLQSI